jgi:hypothetical protein
MVEMLYTARVGVDEEVLGTANTLLKSYSGVLRGLYKVRAMPPVARMPQRTVLGEDMMLSYEVLIVSRNSKVWLV